MNYIDNYKKIEITDLPKEKGFCYWSDDGYRYAHTQCDEYFDSGRSFTYCPYCGKKIKRLIAIKVYIRPEMLIDDDYEEWKEDY